VVVIGSLALIVSTNDAADAPKAVLDAKKSNMLKIPASAIYSSPGVVVEYEDDDKESFFLFVVVVVPVGSVVPAGTPAPADEAFLVVLDDDGTKKRMIENDDGNDIGWKSPATESLTRKIVKERNNCWHVSSRGGTVHHSDKSNFVVTIATTLTTNHDMMIIPSLIHGRLWMLLPFVTAAVMPNELPPLTAAPELFVGVAEVAAVVVAASAPPDDTAAAVLAATEAAVTAIDVDALRKNNRNHNDGDVEVDADANW